jgi:hypothetical protein
MTLNTRFRATTRIAAIQCSCCNFYGNGPSGWRAPSSLVDLYNRGQCAPRIPSIQPPLECYAAMAGRPHKVNSHERV